MRVLFLDDDRIIAKAITRMLERIGEHEVDVVHTVEEAVDLLKRSFETMHYDVIVSDWNVGRETSQALLDVADEAHVPKVVISGNVLDVPSRYIRLEKPVAREALFEAMREAVEAAPTDQPRQRY